MISYFSADSKTLVGIQTVLPLSDVNIEALQWLLGNARLVSTENIDGNFIGPRASMITPWSTNAVEITQNMGINSIIRMEQFQQIFDDSTPFDRMLFQKYHGLNQSIFENNLKPASLLYIDNIQAYNLAEGLSLSDDEVEYLEQISHRIDRKLTDSEIFGFSQVNSEHCRHKIFNGSFIIDGKEMPSSLFNLIKLTSAQHRNEIVSAYKDNVAFVKGPVVQQFAPLLANTSSYYTIKNFESVLSLKAETHNFPTTVEPFNGAATGSGGEIRDRLAGGRGSIPMAGTAVYMTPYPRLKDSHIWEAAMPERSWLYQTPMDILIKASNGASDFGNKFGQPLICGSLLTFEHEEDGRRLGYDKVIMLAGGVGYGRADQAEKAKPKQGDAIVVLGGDNYRIGMGGAAVSSVDTGLFDEHIELNAVQRSNPEMQKRVANTIRAMIESTENAIVSIHDHGAGGHLNCLSELVEEVGGEIYLDKLPVGDPTLSAKEIIGNESQERMGLVISKDDLSLLHDVAERERSPMYVVGEITGDHRFKISSQLDEQTPIDLSINDMFGSSPKTIIKDKVTTIEYDDISYDKSKLYEYVQQVLKLESVACKDWLTNKVDRCVGGKVAKQQCAGELQLPLNNCGVMALDYEGPNGIATSIGHAPLASLIDIRNGMRNALAESLTNIIWAPLKSGLKSISLSANWMWPCKNEGEDARLYEAVKSISEFAIELGINIPTGKDSLSMAQKYKDGTVISPGTVIISTIGQCCDISAVIEPVLQLHKGEIILIDFSEMPYFLGGSAFGQVMNKLGKEAPGIQHSANFARKFDLVQDAIKEGMITAGHDVSAGGIITTLLEMCFASTAVGATINLTDLGDDIIKNCFAENAAIIVQASDQRLSKFLASNRVKFTVLGEANATDDLKIIHHNDEYHFNIEQYRDIWFETSYLLDKRQTSNGFAKVRYDNYKHQPLVYKFPAFFHGGSSKSEVKERPKAAVVREKGSNSERELANALFRSGFDVKDVHMTDLVSGRETLEDIRFLGAVGGFSNSDVLGSAKGWAGTFKYSENARQALEGFFKRKDTLSIGVCNGCQLFLELDLINPDHNILSKMHFNDSRKHESIFTSVTIQQNNAVMMQNLEGCTLGVWVSHGEGKFYLPLEEEKYNIVAKFGYDAYPSNPNGSNYNTAMLASDDGRHLATMPHIERSFYPWNWAYYPKNRKDSKSPWYIAFENAHTWLINH